MSEINDNMNLEPSFGEGTDGFSEFDFQGFESPMDAFVPVNTDTSIPVVPTSGGFVNAGYDTDNPFDVFKKVQAEQPTESDIAFEAAKPYSFASGYKQTNFNRYYNDEDNFFKIGFNPIANNEEIYNANRSWYQDLWRSTSHIPHLGLSFVKSGYRSVGDMFSGDFSMTDEKGAAEFEEIMANYGSTKEGVTGFTSNLLLQSGIVAGIAADYIVTEAALAGASALSEGVALPAALTAMGAKTAQLGKRISDLRKISNVNVARDFYKAVKAGEYGKLAKGVGTGVTSAVKNLAPQTIGNVRNLISGNTKLTNLAQVTRGVGDFIMDVKKISYTTSESAIEGGGVKNEFIDKKVQEFINEKGYYPEGADLDKIYQYAEDAGFTTGMINAPLIYLTNGIVFDNLFKGGKTPLVKRSSEIVKRAKYSGKNLIFDPKINNFRVTKGFAENLKLGLQGLRRPGTYGEFTKRYFAANFAEGFQESSQEIVSGASKDYFERLYDNAEVGGINMYLSDAFENLKAQASMQGLEVFASGFLMGGLSSIAGGTGGFIKRKGLQAYYAKKNTPEAYEELYGKEEKQLNQIATELNEVMDKGARLLTPDFENLLVQIKAGADMVEAKESFDEKAFHDIKDASRFNAIYTALQTGKYDFFLNKLEDLKQLSGKELKEHFELADSVSDEDARKVLDVAIDRANQIKQQYEEFSEYENPFKPEKFRGRDFSNLETFKDYLKEKSSYEGFEDARKVAVFSLHNTKLLQKRLQDLSDNLTGIANIGELAFSDITPLLSISNLDAEIELLKKEIENSKGIKDEKLAEQIEKKKKKLKHLEQFKRHYGKENKERWLKGGFIKYMNDLAEESGKSFDKTDLEEAFNLFVDYLEVGQDLDYFKEAVNTLADPVGFYAEVNRRIAVRKKFNAKRKDYIKNSFEKFLNDAKNNDLINFLLDSSIVIDKTTIPEGLKPDYETFKDFLLNNPDVKFEDTKTLRTFGKDDPRFKTIKALIDEFDNLVKKAAEEEKKKTEKAPKKPEAKKETPKKPEDKVPVIKTVAYEKLHPKVKEFVDTQWESLSDAQKGSGTVQDYTKSNLYIQKLNAFINSLINLSKSTRSSNPIIIPTRKNEIVDGTDYTIANYIQSSDFAVDSRVGKLLSDYGLEVSDILKVYGVEKIATAGEALDVSTINDYDISIVPTPEAHKNAFKDKSILKAVDKEDPESIFYLIGNKEGDKIIGFDVKNTSSPATWESLNELIEDIVSPTGGIRIVGSESLPTKTTVGRKFKQSQVVEKRDDEGKVTKYIISEIRDNGEFLLNQLDKNGRSANKFIVVTDMSEYYPEGKSPSNLLPKTSAIQIFQIYNTLWKENPELQETIQELILTTPTEELYKNLQLVVKRNKLKNRPLNYYVKGKDNIENRRIAYAEEPLQVEVKYKNQTLGFVRDPNSLRFFDENENPVSVDNLTESLYRSIFGYNQGISNPDDFQKNYYALKNLFDTLENKLKNKQEIVLKADEIEDVVFQISSGSYAFTNNESIPFSQLDYQFANDKKGVYLIDRYTDKDGVAKEDIITKGLSADEISDIEESINKPSAQEGYTVYQNTTKNFGRFVAVVKLPNGTYKFVELRPEVMGNKQQLDLFNRIIEAGKNTRENNVIYDEDGKVEGQKQTGYNLELNQEIRDNLFFAINPKISKYKSESTKVNLTLEVSDKGIIIFEYMEPWMQTPQKFYIDSTLVNSLDDLIRKLLTQGLERNKNTKLDISIPGLRGKRQKQITSKDIENFKSSIRQGFPKQVTSQNLDDVLSKMRTSLSPSIVDTSTLSLRVLAPTNVSAPAVNTQGKATTNTSLKDNTPSTKKDPVESPVEISDNPSSIKSDEKLYGSFNSLQEQLNNRKIAILDELAGKGLKKSEKNERVEKDPEYKRLNDLLRKYSKEINSRIANKDASSWNKDDVDDLDDFTAWLLRNLPEGVVTVEEAINLSERMLNGNVTVGSFYSYLNDVNMGIEGIRGVIKTAKDAPFKYHEAFHSVFRLFLTDEEIEYYLGEAKKEVRVKLKKEGKQLSSLIKDMVATNPDFYNKMTRSQLEKRFFEEYLADRFQEYMKLSQKQQQDTKNYKGIKGFFYKLASIIKSFFRRYTKNSVDTLFDKINTAQLKSRPIQKNVFTDEVLEYGISEPALKAIKLEGVDSFTINKSGKIVKVDRYLSSADTINLTSSIAASVIRRYEEEDNQKTITKIIDEVITDYENLYDGDENPVYGTLNGVQTMKWDLYEEIFASPKIKKDLKESVVDHIRIIRKINELAADVTEDLNKEEDYGLRNSNNYNESTETTGGFGKLTSYIKSFLATTTFLSSDEFGNTELVKGEPIMQAVDAKAAYDGILNIAAGSQNEYDFYLRLKYFSGNNPNMRAVITRLFEEAAIELDEDNKKITISNPKKAMIAQLFYKSMGYLQNVPYQTMLKGTNGIVKINNSNQQGTAKFQLDIWKNGFNNTFYNKILNDSNLKEETIKEATKVIDNLTVFLQKEELIDLGTEKASDELLTSIIEEANVLSTQLYNSLGISLKPDFLVLSTILNNDFGENLKVTSNYKTETGKYFVNLYLENEDIYKDALTEIDLQQLRGVIKSGKNPFLKLQVDEEIEDIAETSKVKDVEDEFSNESIVETFGLQILYKLSRGNSKFDETVNTTTWTKENGDKIWSFQLPTFNRTVLNKIKNLVNTPIETLNRVYRDNPLFKNQAFRELTKTQFFTTKRVGEFKQQTLSQTATGTINENSNLDINRFSQGKDYKNFSPRDLMLYLIELSANDIEYLDYFDSNLNKNVRSYRSPSLIRILEASRTAETISLPIIKAISQTKSGSFGITKEYIDNFIAEIKREFARIQEAKAQIAEIEEIGEEQYIKNGGEVIEGYHNGAKRGLDFYSMKNLLMFEGSSAYNTLLNPDTTEEIFEDEAFMTSLKTQMKKYFVSEVKSFLDVLENMNIIKEEEGSIKPVLLSNVIIGNKMIKGKIPLNNVNFIGSKKKNALQYNLAQIFLNDYHNTLFYNNITQGDQVFGLKNAVDAIKRAKGINAAFIKIATDITAPDLGITHPSRNSHVLLFDEPTVKSDNTGENIDRADGQTYTTVKGVRYIKWGLGRLNYKVAKFLDDIEAGVPITSARFFGDKDLESIIKFDGAMNSLKLVYYDDKLNYLKTSVFILTKELTSRKTKDGWKALEGRETLHNLRERLEAFENVEGRETFTFAAPVSVSKAKKKNVFKGSLNDVNNTLEDGSLVVNDNYFTELDNNFWGLQQENPAGKKKITDLSQMKIIVQSEQNDNTEVDFFGKTVKIKDIQEIYEAAGARKIALNYEQKVKDIFDLEDVVLELGKSVNINKITPRLSKFVEYAREIIEATGGSSQLLSFFSLDSEGNPKYNLNNILTEGKFVELFMSYFRSVTNEKVKGDSLTLVSDLGFNVLREVVNIYPNGAIETRVVTQNEIKKNKKYRGDNVNKTVADFNNNTLQKGDLYFDRLRHNQPVYDKRGNILSTYAETLIPPLSKSIMDYFNRYGFAPEVITDFFAARIPSQDVHSSQSFKIVDFLPVFYSSVVVAPAEMVEITGHDFDVDKLYAMFKEFYTKKVKGKDEFIEYGTVSGKQERFQEFLKSQFKNKNFRNKYREVEERLEQEIDNELLELEEMGYTYEELQDMYDFDNLIDKKQVIELALKDLELPFNPEEYAKATGTQSINDKNFNVNKQIVPEILHNIIVESRKKFVSNKDFTQSSETDLLPPVAFQPADTEPFTQAIETFKEEFPELREILSDTGNFEKDSLTGKIKSFGDIMEGADGIGPSVVTNIAYHFLNTHNIKLRSTRITEEGDLAPLYQLDIDGVKYFDFSSNVTQDGTRKAYLLSAMVTAMTDNAKLVLASKFGLDPDGVGTASYMLALGVPFNNVLKFTSSKALKLYKDKTKNALSAFKTQDEKASKDVILAQLINELANKLGVDLSDSEQMNELLSIQQEDLDRAPSLSVSDDYLNLKLLFNLQKITKQSTYISKLANIIRISQGFGKDFRSLDSLIDDIEDVGLKLSNNRYTLSDEEYLQSYIPFDLNLRDRILNQALVTKAYIQVVQSLDSISSLLFIRRTPGFKMLYSSILENFDVQGRVRNKFEDGLVKDLLSYFTLKSFIVKEQKKGASSEIIQYLNNGLIYKQTQEEQEEGFKNIIDIVEDLTSKYPENKFLNYLNIKPLTYNIINDENEVEEKRNAENKKNINYIESNTWTSLSKPEAEALQLSLLDLYSKDETRDKVLGLIGYLMVKDGLQFKSGTFLSILPPEILDSYMSSVGDSLNILSKNRDLDASDSVYESYFGAPIKTLISDFVKNYSKHIANSLYVKRIKTKAGKDYTSSVDNYKPYNTTKLTNNGEYFTVSMFDGAISDYLRLTPDENGIIKKEVTKDADSERLNENLNYLSELGFKIKYTQDPKTGKNIRVLNFPYFIRRDVFDPQTERTKAIYYELSQVSTSLVKDSRTGLDAFIGENFGSAFGSGAVYRRSSQNGVKQATPIGFIFDGDIPLNSAIRADLKSLKEKVDTPINSETTEEETSKPTTAQESEPSFDVISQLREYGIKQNPQNPGEYFDLETSAPLKELEGFTAEQVLKKIKERGVKKEAKETPVANNDAKKASVSKIQSNGTMPAGLGARPSKDDITKDLLKGVEPLSKEEQRKVDEFKKNCKKK